MYDFHYEQPATPAAAAKACEGDARYLAGGQSLVQAMKLHLVRPEKLIGLHRVAGLGGIACDGQTLRIGAMVRHSEVAASETVRQAVPALAELASWIGDPMVRHRGTLGGSVANADPAACYPAALLALDATVVTDRHEHTAERFFTGLYETALEPGELVLAVRFRLPLRAAYEKFRQPASRFATVGVFVAAFADHVRVAVTGAGAHAFRATRFEQALDGRFAPQALASLTFPADDLMADLHASAAYRAHLVAVLARRAVQRALHRATMEGTAAWN